MRASITEQFEEQDANLLEECYKIVGQNSPGSYAYEYHNSILLSEVRYLNILNLSSIPNIYQVLEKHAFYYYISTT